MVTITSTGSTPLVITRLELVDQATAEFQAVADSSCIARPLALDETCTVDVTFQPTQAGSRSARLIIHQNLPPPDTGTPVELVGDAVDAPATT